MTILDKIRKARELADIWGAASPGAPDRYIRTVEAYEAAIALLRDDELLALGEEVEARSKNELKLSLEVLALTERAEAAEAKYHELLLAVCCKYPGESRHETALRYIRERESRPGQAIDAAIGAGA